MNFRPLLIVAFVLLSAGLGIAQTPSAQAEREAMLLDRIAKLEERVASLEAKLGPTATPTPAPPAEVAPAGTAVTPEDRKTLDFLKDTTISVDLDTYYEYNTNRPVGRVNLLRAYDVLSNNFNLNQAGVIIQRPPDLTVGRRYGARLDLQFGQATDTLQGNPANEPRPAIYRNVYQAYGTYVFPVLKGLTVDFGKWSSSLSIEGNYTKDQVNYSRSFYFDYLPFYHMGIRTALQVNDRLAVYWWSVNGTNQVEATNGFKDELVGFTVNPTRKISWSSNYYMGNENPNRVAVAPTGPIPVQTGLSFAAITPAPDGRVHIFDNYGTWQTTSKLTTMLEGDYVIQRLWRHDAPGQSAAPSHVIGGVAYARYQFTPRWALGGRAEYLSDRGGLFSGITQALKETTGTLDYKLDEGLLLRGEYRRDFSNQPSFLTSDQGILGRQQTTLTAGIVFWWGRKQGIW